MRINNQSRITFTTNRLQQNKTKMDKTIDKLSTGISIRQASDNAGGLAVSETMRAQIRGTSQAQRNMQDGLSLLEVANEGLNHVNGLLQRARELGVASSTDTLNPDDREANQLELVELMASINDTAEKMSFNTKKILNQDSKLDLQIGAYAGQTFSINLFDTSTDALGLNSASILTQNDASNLISTIDSALNKITAGLTKIGSHQEALEHQLTNSVKLESNITNSLSMIKDTDVAKESLQLASLNIRMHSDRIIASNVNTSTKDVLKLFL